MEHKTRSWCQKSQTSSICITGLSVSQSSKGRLCLSFPQYRLGVDDLVPAGSQKISDQSLFPHLKHCTYILLSSSHIYFTWQQTYHQHNTSGRQEHYFSLPPFFPRPPQTWRYASSWSSELRSFVCQQPAGAGDHVLSWIKAQTSFHQEQLTIRIC